MPSYRVSAMTEDKVLAIILVCYGSLAFGDGVAGDAALSAYLTSARCDPQRRAPELACLVSGQSHPPKPPCLAGRY